MLFRGDLVRYNPDGTLNFVGRKDTQIKIRGQRLELGEIEQKLASCQPLQHVFVTVPKSGKLHDRLTAVITTKRDELPLNPIDMEGSPELATHIPKSEVARIISEVRSTISDALPVFMVPTAWAVIEDMPMNKSKKIDRKCLDQWLVHLDDESYDSIMDATSGTEESNLATTAAEKSIQLVVSRVLGLSLKQTNMSWSFVSMGGDSITAMQVMSACRTNGLGLTVQEIIRSKSLVQLSQCARQTAGHLQSDSGASADDLDVPFALSPIQQLYFDQAFVDESWFNQSMAVKVAAPISCAAVDAALQRLVEHHSMMRARFSRNAEGRWNQRITDDTKGSYKIRQFTVDSPDLMDDIAKTSQVEIDVENGPMLVVDIFHVENGEQYMFLTASHLVVDLVSWRVLLDNLQASLSNDQEPEFMPMSFQQWCRAQKEYAQEKLSPAALKSFSPATFDTGYWGLGERSNTYADTLTVDFTMDASVTASLLGDAHRSLRTDFVDLSVAALLQSFQEAFSGHSTPAVFLEGHGRETWDEALDISSTVGWFTTMYPLQIACGEAIDTVISVKDARRAVPKNGWPYFASRFLNPEGVQVFGDAGAVEVIFNYAGQYQQLEDGEALLQLDTKHFREATVNDISPSTRRFALFEINAEVHHGVAHFSIVYNKHIRHADSVAEWCLKYKETLTEMASRLRVMEPRYTVADFPLLSLSPSTLEQLLSQKLPALGLSQSDVENMYPCSPMQQGLLVSQVKQVGSYDVKFYWEVLAPVDPERLSEAWQQVVDRHAILRTIFLDSTRDEGLFDQVVLKPRAVPVVVESSEAAGPNASSEFFAREIALPAEGSGRPRHCLSTLRNDDRTFCRLDISHALIDGGSTASLERDLALALNGQLAHLDPLPAVLDHFVEYVSSWPMEESVQYWENYLRGVDPSPMPPILDNNTRVDEIKEVRYVDVDVDQFASLINAFCADSGFTASNLFQAVWAIVLRTFTSSDTACFGYIASGRDLPIVGIQDAVGPFMNMLICSLVVDNDATVESILETVQNDVLRSLAHQICPLAQIQHSLGLSEGSLFNTVMSFQRVERPDTSSDRNATRLRNLGGKDVSEVSKDTHPHQLPDS